MSEVEATDVLAEITVTIRLIESDPQVRFECAVNVPDDSYAALAYTLAPKALAACIPALEDNAPESPTFPIPDKDEP